MHIEELSETTALKKPEEVGPLIKAAIEKTKVLKETDLAYYIPHGDTHISHENFIRIKESDKNSFSELIKEHILNTTPKKISSPETQIPPLSPRTLDNLETIIEKAMKKIDVKQEAKLCQYIPYYDGRLHHFTFNQLRKNDPEKLSDLITSHILLKKPKKLVRKNKKRSAQGKNPLDKTIAIAMKRRSLKLKKEEDLCLYLPHGNSRLHPLGFRSMKEKNPESLKELIEQYVLAPRKPKVLEWKRKAQTLENEQLNEVENTEPQKKNQLDQIIEALQESTHLTKQFIDNFQNPQFLLKQNPSNQDQTLAPFNNSIRTNDLDSRFERYFKSIQNQLISQIRQKKVDHELWNKFSELVENVYESF